MHNSDTTICENVRYFLYKYKIVYNHWFNDRSNIFKKIDNEIRLITQLDDIMFTWCCQGFVGVT